MSLDAAILDRPVINIDFSTELGTPRGLLYAEYDADHYKPLVASGGIRMARGWGDLASLLESAINNPGLDSRERAEMVRAECGTVDGEAASRVAGTLLGLLGSASVPATRWPARLAGAVLPDATRFARAGEVI